MTEKREYENSFKIEAVKLVKETNINKAARYLDIPESTLRQWVRKTEKQPDNPFVGSGNKYQTVRTSEEVRLIKEIKELKRANDILKEALGFFTNSMYRKEIRMPHRGGFCRRQNY